MQSITFTCETITPMFLSGADGVTPELRPPSIKGALRFWWRALNGDLAVRQDQHWNYAQMKKEEAELFGGTGNDTKRSSLLLQVLQDDNLQINPQAEPVPHKPFMKTAAIQTRQKFEVILRHRDKSKIEQIESLFVLVALLGGLGKRSRRGMGCFTITQINGQPFLMPKNAKEIWLHLQKVVPNKFIVKSDSLIESNFGKTPDYPYIKKIQIGQTDSRLLRKISETTHQIKEKNPASYDVSMGSVRGGRFASPIYVSVLQGNIPIITTLNAVPKRDTHKVSSSLQDEFKNKIL